MVNVHADWSTPGFGAHPVAPDVGPFAGRAFLEAVWLHQPSGDLTLVEGGGGLIPLVTDSEGLRWVGHSDLVDYRSPLGGNAEELLSEVMASRTRMPYRFDSLPEEAARVVGNGLKRAGLEARARRHEVTARVMLPGTFEDYLKGLGKKERHEVRRKLRRFREDHGSPELATVTGAGDGFAAFVRLHRSSSGAKGSFMTEEMEAFFATLAARAGWQIDLLYGGNGDPLAAAFGWADDGGFYVYNSAYDPRASGSPGIVLTALLIERAIGSGCRVFDFLKGDEPYKFRMGASARPLYAFGSP